MYPRAKFGDGLSMIEKLGHSKRVQLYRKQWIDEGKPSQFDDQPVVVDPIDTNVDIDTADTGEKTVFDEIMDGDLQHASAATKAADLPNDSVMNFERESSVPDADELDMLLHENS